MSPLHTFSPERFARAVKTQVPIQQQELLEDLARRLTARHLQVCIPDDGMRRLLLPKSSPFLDSARRGSRIIAVVGAGASKQALPDTGEILIELVDGDPHVSGYREELARITRVHRLEEDEFETQLAALSRTAGLEKRVRDHVHRVYNVRHPTVLAYELLAHLLKHRFVDAIISFNFDELLDQSISDELGTGEFVRVVSERDCRDVVWDADSARYLPLFIKLHGTASDPDSLRFTRESYYSTRKRIDDGIKELLGTQDCTLINIGCSLRSFEFNPLLRRPKRLEVFSLSGSGLRPPVRDEIRSLRRSEQTHFRDLKANKWQAGGAFSGYSPTDLLVLASVAALQRTIAKECRGSVYFRSIKRHLLVARLFGSQKEVSKDRIRYREYLKDRANLETAFVAVTARGLVSIDSLVRQRCAGYFDEYEKRSEAPVSWHEVCGWGGLVPHEVASETFVADRSLCAGRRKRRSVNREFDIGKLTRHVVGSMQQAEVVSMSTVRSTLADLQENTEVEIRAQDDSICAKTFADPKTLRALTSLHAQTQHELKSRDYNQIAVIAETGEWLKQDPFKEIFKQTIRRCPNLRIYLIIAFDQHSRALRQLYGRRIRIQRLDWWLHNRHMTIFCKDDVASSAVYFARRLRSSFVTPVYLGHPSDAEALLKNFMRYWVLASRGSALIPPHDLPERLSDLL